MRQAKSLLFVALLTGTCADTASASRPPDGATYFPYSHYAGFVVVRKSDRQVICKGRNPSACPADVRAELESRTQSRVVKRVRGSRADYAIAPLAAAWIGLNLWGAAVQCWDFGRAGAKLNHDLETMPWVSPRDQITPAQLFLLGSGSGTSALYVLIRSSKPKSKLLSALPKLGRVSTFTTGAVAAAVVCGAVGAGGNWFYDAWIREPNDVQTLRGER